jgi:hypothetical protein
MPKAPSRCLDLHSSIGTGKAGKQVNRGKIPKSAGNAAVQSLQMDCTMNALEALIFLSSLWPLAQAWRANRHTTLRYALAWLAAAWLAWGALTLVDTGGVRYLALCLTGCAAVAVLGARLPIAGAWNFVVLGLLTVLWLPWFENILVRGGPLLDPLRLLFVIATLAVGVLNYLPTRLAGAVLMLALACAAELVLLLDVALAEVWRPWLTHVSRGSIPLACWLPWAMARRSATLSAFDRQWLAFRDRFGLMWGQRVREQFNRAAANAGWPVVLGWNGLRASTFVTADMVETLGALLKRFGL